MFEELMDFTMTGHGVSVQFRVLRMGTDCLVLAAGGGNWNPWFPGGWPYWPASMWTE